MRLLRASIHWLFLQRTELLQKDLLNRTVMKYLLTAMCLGLLAISEAQIVSIPDNNFKSRLIAAGVDINNDGQIQQTEADAVTTLNLNRASIADLTGILSFRNLQVLDCSSNQVSRFDISGHRNIESVNIADSFLYIPSPVYAGLV